MFLGENPDISGNASFEDDGFMVVLDVILRYDTSVHNLFLGEEVNRIGFLHQDIAHVFLICKNTSDSAWAEKIRNSIALLYYVIFSFVFINFPIYSAVLYLFSFHLNQRKNNF